MSSTFEERLNRARQADFDVYVIDDNPLVVEIDSGDSTYTVVPNTAYCNCPDRTYRNLPCKHTLYLAIGNDVAEDVRQTTIEGFRHHEKELNDEINETADRLEELRERHKPWIDATYHFVDAHEPADVVDRPTHTDSGFEWSTSEPEKTDKGLSSDPIKDIASTANRE